MWLMSFKMPDAKHITLQTQQLYDEDGKTNEISHCYTPQISDSNTVIVRENNLVCLLGMYIPRRTPRDLVGLR